MSLDNKITLKKLGSTKCVLTFHYILLNVYLTSIVKGVSATNAP
jgi:hypothetical protein